MNNHFTKNLIGVATEFRRSKIQNPIKLRPFKAEPIQNPKSKIQNRVTALILSGLLCIGTGAVLSQTASATPVEFSQSNPNQLVQEKEAKSPNKLPPQIVNAVRSNLSRLVRIAPEKLKIISYSQKAWPNGCLGLAGSDEFCTQAIVPGWRVVVSDSKKSWVYRTDSSGRNLRLEKTP